MWNLHLVQWMKSFASSVTGAVLFTGSITILGFAVKYINDLTIQRRKDRLDRINQQLKLLYGPLYAASHAGEIAYRAFRGRYRHHKPYFSVEDEPTPEDLAAWRLWMQEVFMPLNVSMEKAIVENGDMLLEDKMPRCLMELCAHVAAYKPILKRWEKNDFEDHLSLSEFPRKELNQYVNRSYRRLKREQRLILGALYVRRSNASRRTTRKPDHHNNRPAPE